MAEKRNQEHVRKVVENLSERGQGSQNTANNLAAAREAAAQAQSQAQSNQSAKNK
jgi:hypothetical protein